MAGQSGARSAHSTARRFANMMLAHLLCPYAIRLLYRRLLRPVETSRLTVSVDQQAAV